jgi:hypothetical protein
MRPKDIKMSDVIKWSMITINVRLVHDWRFRLGVWLIRLGGMVIGCRIRTDGTTS